MPFKSVPEGWVFVEGRSQATAAALLEAAEAVDASPSDVIAYTLKGYAVPQAVYDEYQSTGVTPKITFPGDGDLIGVYAGISGIAEPGSTVELFMATSPGAAVDSQVATSGGTFDFFGRTPLTPGPETIHVAADGIESDPVHVTIYDSEEEGEDD